MPYIRREHVSLYRLPYACSQWEKLQEHVKSVLSHDDYSNWLLAVIGAANTEYGRLWEETEI